MDTANVTQANVSISAEPLSGALIQVQPQMLGERTVPAVLARAVHEQLGVRRDFTSWIKAQIRRARLMEGRDWVLT